MSPKFLGNRARFQRRELLRVGGLNCLGLTLPRLLGGRADAATSPKSPLLGFGRARSCIFILLKGGPSHLDTVDMKPDAPLAIRGDFRPIATTIPGLHFCEHLPALAGQAARLLVLRSLSHQDSNHPTAAYWMTTGHRYPRPGGEVGSRLDHPHVGSTMAALRGRRELPVPPFVMLPEYIIVNGQFRSGQYAGVLGSRFDPMVPDSDTFQPSVKRARAGLDPLLGRDRIGGRKRLLRDVESQLRGWDRLGEFRSYDSLSERAFELLASGSTRQAFDLHDEPPAAHERYGRTAMGRCLLLARRLVEAGVPLVHVNAGAGAGAPDYSWDTQERNFELLQRKLLPTTDRACAALIGDLASRGLLDETLVVITGEFGRTPKINGKAGRDHWPSAFSAILAGGGMKAGAAFGATDRLGAHVARDAVTPGELAATILHALGLDPRAELRAFDGRPWKVGDAEPVVGLWS
jgi:hypothetical protein